MSASSESYRNTNIMTASPMELIIMLYDEAIKSLTKAEDAFKIEGPERIQEVNNNLLHVQDIITELTSSLNFEKGGQIATNLYNLYDFMIYQLSQANVKKQLKPVREVRAMLKELREAWIKVAEKEPHNENDIPHHATSGIMVAG